MSLRVVLHPAAERELKKIHKERESFRRIVKAISDYAETGRGDVRVVASAKRQEETLLALRVGEWRIHFGVIGDTMYVVGMERRPKAYQPWVLEAARRRLRELGVELG
ncbi:MAG: hypothetical protein QW084_05270 [Candidatus Hadarchaeales archaeon]